MLPIIIKEIFLNKLRNNGPLSPTQEVSSITKSKNSIKIFRKIPNLCILIKMSKHIKKYLAPEMNSMPLKNQEMIILIISTRIKHPI